MAGGAEIRVRAAIAAEIAPLEALIERSARALSVGYYDARQTEAAIAHVFGVDSQLIEDGSYLVAVDPAGAILGCGGWSRRQTLFGGDRYALRRDNLLDPASDPARIRAFFVDPAHARRGVGAALLAACEEAVRAAGFTATALMATLPGVAFYARHGYVAAAAQSFDLGGTSVAFVPMSRTLCTPQPQCERITTVYP